MKKHLFTAILGLILIPQIQAASFATGTYNALGGDAENDTVIEALDVLSYLVDTSKTNEYRTVVKSNNGSAVWIGNSSSKSYFMTVAHVANAATNIMTTYDGTTIDPVVGSFLHTQTGDFGLLEYNSLLNPALFGGESLTLMDYNLVENYLGQETSAVGYGNLTIGDRRLGRNRMLSYANLTGLDGGINIYRTRSSVSGEYDPTKPYAGVITQGDSGGGVFLNIDGENILIGSVSAGNLFTGMVYTNIYEHKQFIDSVVPDGVFTWYSDTQVPEPSSAILLGIGILSASLIRTRRSS